MVSPTDMYSIMHNIGKINIWVNSVSNVLVYKERCWDTGIRLDIQVCMADGSFS